MPTIFSTVKKQKQKDQHRTEQASRWIGRHIHSLGSCSGKPCFFVPWVEDSAFWTFWLEVRTLISSTYGWMQAMWSPQAGSDALLNSWLNIFCFLHFLTDILSTFLCQHKCQVPCCLVETATDEWREKRQRNQDLWTTYGREALAAWAHRGYRVATRGKSRTTLLICEYEQPQVHPGSENTRQACSCRPAPSHGVFSSHPRSVQLHLVTSALPPGITSTRQSHLWPTGTKVCLRIQLRVNNVSLLTMKWKCIQPFLNYRVEHNRNAIMGF